MERSSLRGRGRDEEGFGEAGSFLTLIAGAPDGRGTLSYVSNCESDDSISDWIHLFGDMLSSMTDLGADLGDCSADAGPERPGGVFLGCGMTMGGAEAARWARLESPCSRDTDREGACWTTVVMVKCAWGGWTLITAANLSCKCAGRAGLKMGRFLWTRETLSAEAMY